MDSRLRNGRIHCYACDDGQIATFVRDDKIHGITPILSLRVRQPYRPGVPWSTLLPSGTTWTKQPCEGCGTPKAKEVDTATQRAIDYAVKVIESYQADMRNVGATAVEIGSGVTTRSLADWGVCQGTIYSEAVEDIKRLREGRTVQ